MTKQYAIPLFRIWAVLTVSVMLPGCAMSQLSSMMPKNPFGSKATKTTAVPVSKEAMLTAAKESASTTNTSSAASVMPSLMKGCPKFRIWRNSEKLTIFEKGHVGDSMAIRHRGEISKVARECAMGQNRNITVKYGISGRLLLGPKGKPGTVTLPALIHVTGQTGKKIRTQKIRVSITVQQGKPFGYFSTVNRISFKVPPTTSPAKLRLYVAFDRSAPNSG